MENTIKINSNQMAIREYSGQRVVMFKETQLETLSGAVTLGKVLENKLSELLSRAIDIEQAAENMSKVGLEGSV